MFKISDKVVFLPPPVTPTEINNAKQFHMHGHLIPKNIYVVEKIISGNHIRSGEMGLVLVGGYTSFHITSGYECGYNSKSFRKLDEVQTENLMAEVVDKLSKIYLDKEIKD